VRRRPKAAVAFYNWEVSGAKAAEGGLSCLQWATQGEWCGGGRRERLFTMGERSGAKAAEGRRSCSQWGK
jgi:hypothetical protein